MKNFLEIFENQTRFGTKIPSPKYLKTGKYPIVDQSKKLICGYSDDSSGLYSNTPFIIFGDVSRTIKYIDFPCYLGADGSVILKVINDEYITKFLYYYLLNQSIPNTGYNRHYKFLKDLKFKEFSYEKQKNAVAILDRLNALIKKSNKEIEYFDELIKSRFNEMFGNPVWNQKMFGTMELNKLTPFNKVKNKVKITDNTWLLNLDMVESNTGKIISKVRTSKVTGSTIEFDTSCILYSKLRPYLNKVVVPDEAGFATSELIALSCNPKIIDRTYLANVLRHESFVDFINSKTAGAKMPRSNMNDLRRFPVPLPPIEQQLCFANFVSQIDKLKFNVQKRIEYYQELLNKKMDEYFN